MQKTFRVFVDVKADNKQHALELYLAGDISPTVINKVFRIQEDLFDDEEEGTILEIARVALADADIYEDVADKLDMSDAELKNLQEKIQKITDRA